MCQVTDFISSGDFTRFSNKNVAFSCRCDSPKLENVTMFQFCEKSLRFLGTKKFGPYLASGTLWHFSKTNVVVSTSGCVEGSVGMKWSGVGPIICSGRSEREEEKLQRDWKSIKFSLQSLSLLVDFFNNFVAEPHFDILTAQLNSVAFGVILSFGVRIYRGSV